MQFLIIIQFYFDVTRSHFCNKNYNKNDFNVNPSINQLPVVIVGVLSYNYHVYPMKTLRCFLLSNNNDSNKVNKPRVLTVIGTGSFPNLTGQLRKGFLIYFTYKGQWAITVSLGAQTGQTWPSMFLPNYTSVPILPTPHCFRIPHISEIMDTVF